MRGEKVLLRKDMCLEELPEIPAIYKIAYPTGILKVGRTKNLRNRMKRYQWEDLIREKFEYLNLISYTPSDDPIGDERRLIAEMVETHERAFGGAYKEWFVEKAKHFHKAQKIIF